MDELAEIRRTVEALTSRVVILEGVIATSMQEAEAYEMDPIEARHRENAAKLRDQ